MALAEAPKRGDAHNGARLRQTDLQLRQGDVRLLDKKTPNEIAMSLGAPRQPIAALRLRTAVATQPAQRLPADGA